MRVFIRYELQEPTKLSILLFFSVLVSAAHKVFLLKQAGQVLSTYPLFPLPELFVDMAQLNTPFYVLASLMASFIVGISARTERDLGVALSIYALPYSRRAILTAKFFSNFLLLVMYSLAIHILVFILHFSGTLEGALGALTAGIPSLILFYAVFMCYIVSISSFIAISSPNTYVAILASFLALYFPVLANIGWLVPTIGTDLNALKTPAFLSVIFFIAYILMGERRDVR